VSRKNAAARVTHLVDALNLKTPVRILDIGANPLIEGEVSYQILLDHGFAEVVGFEPQQDALKTLNAKKSAAETYLPYALGDGTTQTLHLYQSPGFTSVYPANPKSAEYLGFKSGMTETGSEAIKTRKLDPISDIPMVDFLKIDVQGSETAILKYGRKKLSQACAVQAEVRMFPLYQGEPRYGALDNELCRQGFEFLRFAALKHVCLARRFQKRLKRSQFAQAVDGDAFYVRDLRNVETYEDEQLKKLAVIADAIIQSHDLALFALETLLERQNIDMSVIDNYFAEIPEDVLRP